MEHHILYVSTAAHLMTDDELLALLDESRKWNIDHGITGMLIYVEGIFSNSSTRSITSGKAGRFMQILEGSKYEVEYIFEKIKSDKRHHNITPLEIIPTTTRYFESWQMGFNAISTDTINFEGTFFDPKILFDESEGVEIPHPLNFIKSFYARGSAEQTMFSRSKKEQ